jgi:hypothetical protein
VYQHGLSGQLQNLVRSTYTYDASGNMLSSLSESWEGGQWVNSSRDSYTYDANGNETSYQFERWSNGQWEVGGTGICTYDSNGNQTLFLRESMLNGQRAGGERWTFAYDANGNRLSELYEALSTDQWVNSERYAYTSDGQGNLTSVWHYAWVDPYWTVANIGFYHQGGGGFAPPFTDSAGNYYILELGYNFTFAHKLITTGIASEGGNVPAAYSLSQNYPNPFNPGTTITYELPASSMVRLSAYDMLGREVSVLVNERRDAGVHEVRFDGSNLASGVYFYRLQAGDFVQSKSLILLK